MPGPNNQFRASRQEQIDCLLVTLINLFEAHGADSIPVDQLVERPRFQADVRAAKLEMSELYSRALTKWKLKQGDNEKPSKITTAQQRLVELIG